ncbi:MAG: 3'(2'),5'-bisphosphate nucleotidase CysQ [Thaumarchaeota archaeon]|nr:3'(2'),5'-bisphosphate nucleotidase CysQ [Nitrososphaerota archaeon]
MQDIPITDEHSELNLAIAASVESANAIMNIYGRSFGVKTKTDGSPITEADLESNQIIRNILSETQHVILSEEDKDDHKRLDRDYIWIVDPLDGTSDFVDRTGEFTVMIALVRNKKPVLGVINWPAGNTIFAAQNNAGAFRYSDGMWQKITVSGISNLAECRAVGSRHHLTEREKKFIKMLGIKRFTSVGSSLKVGRISSGDAEAYITTTNQMKEWDTAASHCIINEAGGKMTDMAGNVITYNNNIPRHKNGILATNGLIHDSILSEFKKL